jgi:dipeptide/tripeptide permease
VSGDGGERLYRGAVRGFSAIFVVVGIVVLAVTLANGGGPLSTGFFMGLAFLAVGIGRLWLGDRMER